MSRDFAIFYPAKVGSVFKDTPSVYECVLVLMSSKERNRNF